MNLPKELNYAKLLEALNVDIIPLGRQSFHYKSIEKYISVGAEHKKSQCQIKCVDIFEAKRKADTHKIFPNVEEPTLKRPLLWYGSLVSSVAAKLKNGVQFSHNKYTSYRAVSLWDNVIGCSENIGLLNFKNTNSNIGILMLFEVNYNEKKIPVSMSIDKERSTEYFTSLEEYNEDEDTDDESTATTSSNEDKNSKVTNNKFVYCTEIKDTVDLNEMLQITGKYSPDPDGNIIDKNIYIPAGKLVPTTTINQSQGWLNGHLKIWDDYNQYLLLNQHMLKLRFLVTIECIKVTNKQSQQQNTIDLDSPVNNTKKKNNTDIWSSVVKKRSLDDDDNDSYSRKKVK